MSPRPDDTGAFGEAGEAQTSDESAAAEAASAEAPASEPAAPAAKADEEADEVVSRQRKWRYHAVISSYMWRKKAE